MTPDQLKKAANDLVDLERIEEIQKAIASGSTYALQIGTNILHLDRDRSAGITRAVEAYLKGTSALLRQKLAPEVEGIDDPFDAVLDKIDQESKPVAALRKAAADAGHPEWVKPAEELKAERHEWPNDH